jgi:UDP-3-O-[3-hydroxymyristoyl] glucosamine N-acyltransferase
MRFEQPMPIIEIADLINARIIGNREGVATGINEIHGVQEGDLVFVDHPKYFQKALDSAATFIIINKETEVPSGKALLLVEDPFEGYQRIIQHFRPFIPSMKPVSDSAVIGERTVIMPGCFIGNHVTIGSDCIIYPNVVILDHCIIGNYVHIQSGTVIGSDGFYYNKKTNRDIHYKKMNHGGRVVLHNYVEIGANCTIDRGVSTDTTLGDGTKLDNMVHIAHDVVIGRNCLFAAQTAVAGATIVEDEVIVWGQVGIQKTVRIGKGAEIMGQSFVTNNIQGGKKYMGFPLGEVHEKRREFVWTKRIPELWNKVMGS